MQKIYKISSLIIVLKMSILEENVSKLWAELQQMQKYSKTTLSEDFYELIFRFLKL